MLGDQNELPPEPGFARREAHSDKNPPKRERLGRLREPFPLATARKERAHGGTRGSPVLLAALDASRGDDVVAESADQLGPLE